MQGAAHVRVTLAALTVAGAISLVKTALMAEFVGTPTVTPKGVVTGTVSATRGLVVSGAAPVVNCHTKGLAMVRPDARLFPPAIVAVYVVLAFRLVPAVSANVAIFPEASIETTPVGLMQGAAQLKVKLTPADGVTNVSLNAAVTMLVLIATPVALLAGVTAVMAGAKIAAA